MACLDTSVATDENENSEFRRTMQAILCPLRLAALEAAVAQAVAGVIARTAGLLGDKVEDAAAASAVAAVSAAIAVRRLRERPCPIRQHH